MKQIPYIYYSGKFVRDKSLAFRGNPDWKIDSAIGKKYIQHPLFKNNLQLLPYKADFNPEGFRTSTSAMDAQVAVVGDSFIESGNHNADTFTEYLKNLIGEDVSNYGLSWYGPEQYIRVIKELIIPHKPKIIIMSIFEGNDIEDMNSFRTWQTKGYYYTQGFTAKYFFQRLKFFLGDIWKFIDDHSLFAIRKYIAKKRGRFIDNISQRHIQIDLPKLHFPDIISQTADSQTAAELLNNNTWKRLDAILLEFYQLSEKHNFVPLIMHIPRKTHVYKDYISNQHSGSYWKLINTTPLYESAREKALTTLSIKNKIQFISLTKAFQKASAESNPTYYQTDLHWNALGRQIAAKTFAKVLNQKK